MAFRTVELTGPAKIHVRNQSLLVEKEVFNLEDDMIEPFRPSVDLISYFIAGDTIQLDRYQRRKLAEVLLQAVRMNGRKVNIFTAINMMVGSI